MKNTQKNTKILLLCVSIVFFMGALSLAAVPLYDLFCKGYGL
jgi:cytochrome c oxidase assembly protein Cox11